MATNINRHFIGERSGTRTIVERRPAIRAGHSRILVRCDCGAEAVINASAFRKSINCKKCLVRMGRVPGTGKKYIGRPCKRGHSGLRFASNGGCVECLQAAKKSLPPKKRQRDPVERSRAQKRYLAQDDKRQRHISHIRNRRAKQRDADGSHTGEEIAALYQQQNGICCYCQVELNGKFEADHIMPIALGGSNWIDNIQLTCMPCNRKKNAQHPNDFALRMNFLRT